MAGPEANTSMVAINGSGSIIIESGLDKINFFIVGISDMITKIDARIEEADEEIPFMCAAIRESEKDRDEFASKLGLLPGQSSAPLNNKKALVISNYNDLMNINKKKNDDTEIVDELDGFQLLAAGRPFVGVRRLCEHLTSASSVNRIPFQEYVELRALIENQWGYQESLHLHDAFEKKLLTSAQ